jgi:hypothetical protein
MPRLRRYRLFTVLVALCSLLFMQFAVAGYSCPGFESRVQESSAMTQSSMPCAEAMSITMTMDDAQPNLCQAHCQSAKPAGDNAALQVPALATAPALFGIAPSIALSQRLLPLPSLLTRATAPPLTIRNCCLRI